MAMDELRARVQAGYGRDVTVSCKSLGEAHDFITDELDACPREYACMGVIYLGPKIISTRSRIANR